MRHEGGELIDEIVSELRRPVLTDPAAKARIMIALRAARSDGGVRRVWQWLRAPRTLRVSPLAGLAAAAGIVTALLIRGALAPAPRAGSAPPTVESEQSQVVLQPRIVQFVLVAPAASHVALVGDFNSWDATATPLRQASAQGVWSVTVPLTPGRHIYAFVVDDSKWVPDPSAARAPEDDFGAPNSVIMVGDQAS
jgi:Carbohydrate-binding module 48 (Isoamylase N-terminal domain)